MEPSRLVRWRMRYIPLKQEFVVAVQRKHYMDGLSQTRRNSSALAVQ